MTRIHGIAVQTAAGDLVPQISASTGRAVSYLEAADWLLDWLDTAGWTEPDLLGTRATKWARRRGVAMTVTLPDGRSDARLTPRGHAQIRNRLIGKQTLAALAAEFAA